MTFPFHPCPYSIPHCRSNVQPTSTCIYASPLAHSTVFLPHLVNSRAETCGSPCALEPLEEKHKKKKKEEAVNGFSGSVPLVDCDPLAVLDASVPASSPSFSAVGQSGPSGRLFYMDGWVCVFF